MLDIKFIRQNAELVQQAMRNRNSGADISKLLEMDDKRREIMATVENMKAERNRVSAQIPKLKKEGQDTSEIMANMKNLGDQIKALDEQLRNIDIEQKNELLNMPNLPHESVPIGKDEESNVEIKRWGKVPTFDFEAKAHWDIGTELDILDFEVAAKLTGARFAVYRDLGARLERAIIQFFLNTHVQSGFMEMAVPLMVNSASMQGTGQLPKFADDMFHIEDTDYYMISTSEIPLTNLYRDVILENQQLPIRHCAYTPCFRKEAGSAGRDTRGLIRQHQFNKVEMVKVCEPKDSFDELETMTQAAEKVLQLLELPYRVVALSTGDMGLAAAKTYDLEVWMPSYGRYVEISSCSNCTDFQSRRANIKYRPQSGSKAELTHTLNGSGVAVGRTTAAILENYQQQDGSVIIPKALQSYMLGCERIKKK